MYHSGPQPPHTHPPPQQQSSNSSSNAANTQSSSSTAAIAVAAEQQTTPTPPPPQQQQQQPLITSKEMLFICVLELLNPKTREDALIKLSSSRDLEFVQAELAPLLWNSVGVMSALLQDIVNAYPLLSSTHNRPPPLTDDMGNRVCNALALFQAVASHPETRTPFLHAHIPLFVYPFLNTVTKSRAFEYLRLTSLGVIGALVKSDDVEVIRFLLSTEIIPLCLRIMESGSELSKTVATFVIQKILMFDVGLSYICQTPDRFFAVSNVLANMLASRDMSPRLLKHIIRCYHRLTEHPKAREALRQSIPTSLKDGTFGSMMAPNDSSKKWLESLLAIISE